MGVRRLRKCIALLLLCLLLWEICCGAQAGSGVQISYSPDGRAFTTNSGETSTIWYENGTTVHVQERGNPPAAGAGEHIYYWSRTGDIPVSHWKVEHPYGKCIHNSYGQSTSFHGVNFGRQKCLRSYYSGWRSYCRDCGEYATDFMMYMSADTAGAIRSLRTGTGYYYLCPWCRNLEQAREIGPHICKAVSANRYEVIYDGNGGSGYMLPSVHMYHNAEMYEGRKVTPQTNLTLCGFQRTGYRFNGWNTRPDGTGQHYDDGERIYDLSDQEGGQVVLYAQWVRTRSALCIDPGGGSYGNQPGITVRPGDYGSTYVLEEEELVPPRGYRVSFDTRGGGSVESIASRQLFREWSMTLPFRGWLEGSTYHYLGEDGWEDKVTAVYTMQSITLPKAQKPGQSFGGWYYDAACTRPAGGAGDNFTPREDMTLYAGWVELQLQSKDNYTANKGMGAVNLSWSQQDNQGKSYKLYQQREGESWHLVSSASDIGVSAGVSRSMAYTGRQGSYQVPYTGFYRLTLTGAQGGNCGELQGGKGGLVQGIFYLSQGELLSYELGGQNGYHGGGNATAYGTGGGSSQLSSDRQGLLLVAGGGGGATAVLEGMDGGSTGKNVEGPVGESCMAGGGGGYRGGSGGILLTHDHDGNCRHLHEGDALTGNGCYTVEVTCGSTSFRREKKGSSFYYGNRGENGSLCFCVRCGSYICPGHTATYYRNICNQCGRDYDENRPPACTAHKGYLAGCGREENYVCGLEDGQVLHTMPAYGGSSFINAEAGSSYVEQAGYQEGNGALQIVSTALGYLESNLLKGVSARDMGKPEKIEADTVRLTAMGENRVQVSFARPRDTGTVYYHKVESFPQGSDRRICDSNVTVNLLETQVQGYRYAVDGHAGTKVKESHMYHGDPGERPVLTVMVGESLQYLHIAAQDKAGNLGETLHIPISAQTVVAWPVRTEPIRLTRAENIWYAREEDFYYVRAGEGAPFELSFCGVLCGPARDDYQVTHLFVDCQDLTENGEEGRLGTVAPARSDVSPGSYTYPTQRLQKISEGKPCVRDGSYTVVRRSDRCRNLEISQKLYVPESLDGHRIRLTPRAAAWNDREMIYSDFTQDLAGSVWLEADASPPEISGMEQLEEADNAGAWEEGTAEPGTMELELTASDRGSGLAAFYVEVYNQDNGGSQRFEDEGTGRIRITLSREDPLFCGSYTVVAHALDHVGNEAVISSRQQGLSLHVTLERMLEPHDPVFKAGESGILTILAMGYVDRVQVVFPEEMTALDPSLNRWYEYRIPDYAKEEKLEFMIPLKTPEAVMEITVRAWKQDTDIERHPRLATLSVKGNVLEELRTRLKSREPE